MGDYLLTAEKAAATDSKGITLTDSENNPLSFFTYTYMAKEKYAANFEVYVGDKDIVDQDGNPKKYDVNKDGIAETPMLAGTDLGSIRIQEPDYHVMTNLPLDGITATASYTVKETMAPFGDLLEGAMTWNFTYADQHIDIIVNRQLVYDTRQKLQVKIQKLKEAGVWNASINDYDWLYVPAEGITFGLYTKDAVTGDLGALMIPANTLVDVMVTDKDGYAVSTQDITFGNYYIKELKATPDVRLDSKAYDVSAMPVDQTSAVGVVTTTGLTQPIINRAIAGKVNIYKIAADTKLAMPGVVFEVYDKDGILVDTITTDDTGHAKTKVLPYGQYTLIETKTITGYALAEKQTININASQIVQNDGDTFGESDLVIEDQKMAQVDVYKVTADGVHKPMNGVIFGLYTRTGDLDVEVGRLTTDNSGYGFAFLMPGEYFMREISTWPGYSVNKEAIPIDSEFAHVYTFRETNALTEIRVPKTGEEDDWAPQAGAVLILIVGALGIVIILRKRKNT
jgi:LPXTG-motif cell wall-anchored protein